MKQLWLGLCLAFMVSGPMVATNDSNIPAGIKECVVVDPTPQNTFKNFITDPKKMIPLIGLCLTGIAIVVVAVSEIKQRKKRAELNKKV